MTFCMTTAEILKPEGAIGPAFSGEGEHGILVHYAGSTEVALEVRAEGRRDSWIPTKYAWRESGQSTVKLYRGFLYRMRSDTAGSSAYLAAGPGSHICKVLY